MSLSYEVEVDVLVQKSQQICFVEGSQFFSVFVEGGMKISGVLSAGFSKIMVKKLFLFHPRPSRK